MLKVLHLYNDSSYVTISLNNYNKFARFTETDLVIIPGL